MLAPVDPMAGAMPHAEMQLHRRQLLGRKTAREFRRQPGQEARDG